MINNYMCDKCTHALVCKKLDTLVKFDSDDKKYIKVDITVKCGKPTPLGVGWIAI